MKHTNGTSHLPVIQQTADRIQDAQAALTDQDLDAIVGGGKPGPTNVRVTNVNRILNVNRNVNVRRR